VNKNCHANYCLKCNQASIKMGHNKFKEYRVIDESILIWRCIKCTIPRPNDEEITQMQMVIKKIYEKDLKKNELPNYPQN